MPNRKELPQDKGLDNTIAFLKEGYLYITNRRERLNSDMFITRILGGKKVVCMAGKEAAAMFYDNAKFKREGAAPNRVLNTLFGQNGVQTLDGKEHEHRKIMFMDFMTKPSLEEISTFVEDAWLKALAEWEKKDHIILYEEIKKILTVSVCRWTGVPTDNIDIETLSDELAAMFESAEKIGLEHMKGKHARKKVEDWLVTLIESVRADENITTEDRPFYQIAVHRDLDGKHLEKHTAAVEVLNLLRPTVAISVYITLSALALYNFPEKKKKFMSTDKTYSKMFVQEVRRYYPFFPIAPAIVKKDFLWNGHHFKEGKLVLLDLYGNNHHPELWDNPDKFVPERFEDWDKSPFDFIPQGGGDYITGHRCAGEWLTIEVMKKWLDILVNKMTYTVPEQDLKMSMTQMPSIPKSGFVMRDVQNVQT